MPGGSLDNRAAIIAMIIVIIIVIIVLIATGVIKIQLFKAPNITFR